MQCHLNLGSNTGDSLAIIRRAINLIATRIALPESIRVSDPVITPPWGYDSPNDFTNIGVSLTTALSPALLMSEITAIQSALGATPHRNPDGTYRDRNIDIDIIHMGDTIIDTPELNAPHPRMHLRDFVLIPLVQLEQDWIHPILHKTASQLLKELKTRI